MDSLRLTLNSQDVDYNIMITIKRPQLFFELCWYKLEHRIPRKKYTYYNFLKDNFLKSFSKPRRHAKPWRDEHFFNTRHGSGKIRCVNAWLHDKTGVKWILRNYRDLKPSFTVSRWISKQQIRLKDF